MTQHPSALQFFTGYGERESLAKRGMGTHPAKKSSVTTYAGSACMYEPSSGKTPGSSLIVWYVT